jgi:hypothetical protein
VPPPSAHLHKDDPAGPTDPWSVLKYATDQVPALRYAIGVAGIAGAASIVATFTQGYSIVTTVSVGLLIVGMVVLYLFARLATSKAKAVHNAGLVLMWAVVAFVIAFMVFTTTAVAAGWPCNWAELLHLRTSCVAPWPMLPKPSSPVPAPATEPLAPAAAPSGRSSTSEEQTPISWQPDFQMNWYSGPQMAWIRFVGKSTTLAHIRDAYIVSKLTGHRESLEVANATNFNERWNVNQIESIPPGATTMLVYEPKPPPSIPDFLNQWGAFEFHVVYEGGEYTKIYSQDYVHDKFASELPGIYGPHVTPKDNK